MWWGGGGACVIITYSKKPIRSLCCFKYSSLSIFTSVNSSHEREKGE